LWRGYQARTEYRKLLLKQPRERVQNKKLFFAAKLENLTDRLIDSLEAERMSIDKELEALDRSAEQSRKIFNLIQLPKVKINWPEIQKRALSREEQDCPICITALNVEEILLVKKKKQPNQNIKAVSLLNCSHLFHERFPVSYFFLKIKDALPASKNLKGMSLQR
jgi:hypothetical protein